MKKDTTSDLPVIIIGAGPCGLVTSLVLEQNRKPFILIERSVPSKLCSNVGSGFDLAPTANKIMRDHLGLPIEKSFIKYDKMHLTGTEGKAIRDLPLQDHEWRVANRSAMQNLFLDRLLGEGWNKRKNSESCNIFRTKSGTGEIRCGVGILGYEENDHAKNVSVSLDDGTKVVGSILLGCDGIHSKVRRNMMAPLLLKKDVQDELEFRNVMCWWGKTEVKSGSDLNKYIQETEKENQSESITGIWMFGSCRCPGSIFIVPTESNNVFTWVVCVYSKLPPKKSSDDLTRRGGFVLNEIEKKELEDIVSNYSSLVKTIIKETPPSAITKVGLFDRENLDLPYASGRVALLGDAAHPQTPFMGQGVNMAITDAYVMGTRLSKQPVDDAIRAYNSEARRVGVNKIIKEARSIGEYSVSSSYFVCGMTKLFFKLAPKSWLLASGAEGDKSNSDFVAALRGDIEGLV